MSAKTAGYSVKHKPLGRPGGPGLFKVKGMQLPAYIQNIAHALIREHGKTKSQAIQMAIGVVRNWARGGGDVGPEVRAAAAKAIAEWEAKKARAHAIPNKGSRNMSNIDPALELAYSQEGARKTVNYSTGPSQQARAQAQQKGQAFKQGRFPIRNLSDAKKAIHAFGRAKPEDKPALKRFIIRRLRALGHPELIPSSWTSKEMAHASNAQVIELAGSRGPYQRHVKHTEQYGKQKGDLSRKADWRHGYIPLSDVADALKAKHLSTKDLTSSGQPKPGKRKQLALPTPPHLTKSKTDESRSARERSREPGEVTHKESKRQQKTEPEAEGTGPSMTSLRRERAKLEKKLVDNSATPAERKRLNQIVAQIKKRAKPVKSNPARG